MNLKENLYQADVACVVYLDSKQVHHMPLAGRYHLFGHFNIFLIAIERQEKKNRKKQGNSNVLLPLSKELK